MLRRSRTLSVLVLAAAVVFAACSSDSKTATSAGSSAAASAAPKVSGSVTVFAAASLTESFNDEQTTLKTEQPGLSITYSFAGSGALVTQIQQGAPADVIATADTASMKKLTDAGLVEAPATFAKNKLEILVAPGNPKGIKTLSDLARSDIKFVTEDDTVPAGKYSAQILSAAGGDGEPGVEGGRREVGGGQGDERRGRRHDRLRHRRDGRGLEGRPAC